MNFTNYTRFECSDPLYTRNQSGSPNDNKKERKPNAPGDAYFRLFALRLIGGKWCYSVVSHIVQNAADVCRDIDCSFFRLPNECMFQ